MIYNVGGCLSGGLAVAGLFLPLLPTTPFVLLSAFCFSRGSARLHAWLLGHPTMGPIIRDWNDGRVIRRRTKVQATITLPLVMSPALIFGSIPPVLKALSAAVGLLVILMIWRQASRRS